MRRLILFVAFLCLAAPVAAQTAQERAQLDWALERGRLLFEIDRAAWVTTDDLRERLRDPGLGGVRGWTVEREGTGYRVIFYAGEGDARVAIYRARVENNRVVTAQVLPEGARPPLTSVQRRLADARSLLERVQIRACARSGINVAVIPPATDDSPMDVYLLTPQTETGSFPAGGHNRVTVSPTGDILSQRAFTNSCLALSAPPQGEGRPVGVVVTHLLDPIPTEIHVFLAIWIDLPIIVSAGDRVWEVTGEAIRFVTQLDQTPRPDRPNLPNDRSPGD